MRAPERRSLFVGLLSLILVTCLLTASRSAAVTAVEAVQMLSRQREENGIPGGLVERPDWSQACASHNLYEDRTGEFGHSENPASPFYTEAGDWAARNSVLAWGTVSWASGNPWENAPIHLIQMLAPALLEMGVDESHDHICATTWPGYERPQPEVTTAYSYPGNGVTGVVPTERATESPFVPGDFVGLPGGSPTGRYLLAFLAGPSPESSIGVARASLNGPDGPVAVRTVDSTDPQLGPYMPGPSTFVIPVLPLSPYSRYEARIAWQEGTVPLIEQRFTFFTGSDSTATFPHKARRNGGRRCAIAARHARQHQRRARKLRRRARWLARHNRRLQAARTLSRARLAARRAGIARARAKRCRSRAGL